MGEETKRESLTPTDDSTDGTTYLVIVLVATGMGVLSYFLSIFSINATVIGISIATSIGCLFTALSLAANRKVGFAFLIALGNVPIFLTIGSLVAYGLSYEKEISETVKKISSAFENTFGVTSTLNQAVQSGILRKATPQDITSWKNAYLDKKRRENGLHVSENDDALGVSDVNISTTYVVLKAFSFPTGTTKDNNAVFLLPKGVPMPSGEMGYSAIYDFETLTVSCTGARTGAVSC